MKLGFTNLASPNWTIEQVVKAAVGYGYQGLEMRLHEGDPITAALPREARQQILNVCRAASLPIMCLDTSVRVAQPDPAAREAQVQDGLAMLELAAEWGAPCIRVFGGPPQDADPVEADRGAVEVLTRLGERGAALGIPVLLETHDAFASGSRVANVLEKVASGSSSSLNGVGALWDTLHPCRVGEPVEETIKVLGKWLRHVHVKDGRTPASGGSNWDLTLLGEGEVPMPTILAWLHKSGYDGWLSVEWEKRWHPEIAEPEIALPQHLERLREYIKAL